jgi:hypothetical protein
MAGEPAHLVRCVTFSRAANVAAVRYDSGEFAAVSVNYRG